MKPVTKYEADDGTVFDTEREARKHEIVSGLAGWYEDNKLYGNMAGSRVDWDDLLEWIRLNRAVIAKIIANIS